jgi:hypothetical protein
MSINIKLFIHLLCSVLCTAVVATAADADPKTAWKQILQERIPLYGHRNWIVIADSAYPAQSRDGIETIVSGASQIEVLKQVLADLSSSRHIRPIIYTDRELSFVNEADASGIDHYRQQLSVLLPKATVTSLPHEEIINKLDQAGQTFRVLIIKTDLTIPYTTVFLQLDCAYWSAEAERKLRAMMSRKSGH